MTYTNRQLFEEYKGRGNDDYLIEIGNDVWSGNRVTILEWVVISDWAIVEAGKFANPIEYF